MILQQRYFETILSPMETRWIMIPGRPQSAQAKHSRDYREHVAACGRKQCATPLKGRLSACLFFVLHKKSGQEPDLDNLCKLLLDALKGIAYDDDSQIHVSRSEKHYTGERTISSAPIMPAGGALQKLVELKKEECVFIGITEAQL